MITMLRRLFPRPTSFLHNSNLHTARAISASHIFDYADHYTLDTIPFMLEHEFRFSPDYASLALSRVPKSACYNRAYSIMAFLKHDIGFTFSQLEFMFVKDDRFIWLDHVSPEDIKLKFKLFLDLGLSYNEVVRMMSKWPSLLHLSTEDHIIPSLSKLKDLLGSNQGVVKILRKNSDHLVDDKSLFQNLEILKSFGIAVDRIIAFLYSHPSFFTIPPSGTIQCLNEAIKLGVSPGSKTFLHAAWYGIYSDWEGTLRTLQDMGFSKDDSLTMFRKAPCVLSLTPEWMKSAIELLLDNGKYDITDIVAYPSSLLRFSIEKRLKPRLQVLQLLESCNLIEKWPSLPTLCRMSRDKFEEQFVVPYSDRIGGMH